MLETVSPFQFIHYSDVPRLMRIVSLTIVQLNEPFVVDLNLEFKTYDQLYTFFTELFYERHRVVGYEDYVKESREAYGRFMRDLAWLLDVHHIHHHVSRGDGYHARHLPRGGFSCV